MTVSCPNINQKDIRELEDVNRLVAITIVRAVPEGSTLFRFEFPIRMIPGLPFRQAVISSDGTYIIVCSVDKANKDCLAVYNATNGTFISKVLLKACSIKEIITLVPMPHKATQ
ncbi:hypothetical protein DOY81_004788, partial [Sarcophaga bullata]